MPEMEWVWFALMVVFAVAEAATYGLVSIWFVGGAMVSMFLALGDAPFLVQLAAFVFVSALLLVLLRPLAKKLLSAKKTETNARSHIGKVALVTETVDNLRGTGAVKISGVEWSARSMDGEIIPTDTVVRIVELEGAKLTVEKAPSKKEGKKEK